MAENEVTVETTEVPLAESSMSEFKKARADGKETATRETVIEEKPLVEEKSKPKGGFQARIDRLIKLQATLEQELATERQARKDIEAKANGNGNGVTKTEQDANAEPQRDKFATESEYIRALTRWEVKQEIKAEREAEEKEAAAAESKKAISAYNEKAIEAQSRYEDWKEVMAQDISIPTTVGDAIVHTIKNGPDVAYFLGKHPEICEEMLSVHPLEAATMAVNISKQIEKEEGSEAEQENTAREAEEQEKAVKAAEIRKRPPAPIKPVSSGTTRSTVSLDKADFQAYKKLRAQGRVQ